MTVGGCEDRYVECEYVVMFVAVYAILWICVVVDAFCPGTCSGCV